MWSLLTSLAAAEDAPAPPTSAGMIGHFNQATTAMLAVAVNDLDGARAAGLLLAKDKMVPFPLRGPARDLSRARSPERGAEAVAALGRACAECHTAGRRGPVPHDVDELPPGSSIDQHITASTFVWIGLVTPQQQPYELGLRKIFPPIGLDDDEALMGLADRFREVADESLATKAWDQRALLFGTMLETCAECHKLAGVIP